MTFERAPFHAHRRPLHRTGARRSWPTDGRHRKGGGISSATRREAVPQRSSVDARIQRAVHRRTAASSLPAHRHRRQLSRSVRLHRDQPHRLSRGRHLRRAPTSTRDGGSARREDLLAASPTGATSRPATTSCTSEHGVGRYVGPRAASPSEKRPTRGDGDRVFLGGTLLTCPCITSTDAELLGGERATRRNGQAWRHHLGPDNSKVKKATSARHRRRAPQDLRHASDPCPATRFPQGPPWQFRELEATFAFDETADQQAAIDDVIGDMEARKAMDRLVCGDVGYGKTEVAMRAIFRCSPGRQAGLAARADHRPGRAAPPHVPSALRVIPCDDRADVAVLLGERPERDRPQARERRDRRHHRYAPRAVEGHPVQGHRPGRRRRGAALRRGPEGKAQAVEESGRRPGHVGHADPAHAAPCPWWASATSRSSRRRRKTAWPSRPQSCRSTTSSSAKRSSSRPVAAVRSSSSAQPPTVGVDLRLNDARPQRRTKPRNDNHGIEEGPSTWRRSCRGFAPSSATGRWTSASWSGPCSPSSTANTTCCWPRPSSRTASISRPRNTILINHAERFGLSQLYQLRGRVGRSKRPPGLLLPARPERPHPEQRRAQAPRGHPGILRPRGRLPHRSARSRDPRRR